MDREHDWSLRAFLIAEFAVFAIVFITGSISIFMPMDSYGILLTALFLIGLELILDGIGSILMYWKQPWWPDHTIRFLRMAEGLSVIIISLLLDGWR